jgi:flagellar hook-length control protein FliK
MTNLPINVSTAPAQVSSPSASSSDAASQDSQGFGEVLARQVADSTSSAASNDKTADKAGKDTVLSLITADDNTAVVPDITSALPADMIAALLVQQNANGVPTPISNSAPAPTLVNGLLKSIASNVPLATAMATSSSNKAASISPPTIAESPVLPQLAPTALDLSHMPATADTQAKPDFTGTLQGMGKNEIASLSSVNSSNKPGIAELSAAIQQPAVASPTQIPQNNVPIVSVAIANSLSISTPMNQPGWSNELGQKITWLATQNNQSAELHLNPPQLGPLDVVLKVSGDQATALFTSPHAAVRDAIELALPKLREMLADNGIMLGNATVSDQASKKGQDDFARAQQGAGNSAAPVAEVEAVGHQGGRVTAIRHHNGLVDTFA